MGVKEEIRPVTPGFSRTLAVLTQLTPGQMIPAGVVRGFSNLNQAQVLATSPVWDSLETEVRRDVMSALIEAGVSDFEMDYTMFAMLALGDNDAEVRRQAIELSAFIESLPHMQTLFEIAAEDESDMVRAAAIRALGPFILRAELGTISAEDAAPTVDYLLDVLRNPREDSEVRASALEAVSFCSHEAIAGEIARAYDGDDGRLKTAAIFAMGASGDDRWTHQIVHELERGSTENRFEAARAAGELTIAEAVRPLSALALGDDGEIAREAIWALGEIGGKEAVRVLEALLERTEADDDDDLADLVEDALDNANASAGYVFGFDSPDEMN